MTHNVAHILLQALKTPTRANGKIPVWYYVAAACLLSYTIGYLVGKL